MVFNAAPCIQYYTRLPAFLFSVLINHPPYSLVTRLAILDALRRSSERDSYGEIELNLEMNIESNELCTSYLKPPPSHPFDLPHPRQRIEMVSLRLPVPITFLYISMIDSFYIIYLHISPLAPSTSPNE